MIDFNTLSKAMDLRKKREEKEQLLEPKVFLETHGRTYDYFVDKSFFNVLDLLDTIEVYDKDVDFSEATFAMTVVEMLKEE
jgi:hypothetical protein